MPNCIHPEAQWNGANKPAILCFILPLETWLLSQQKKKHTKFLAKKVCNPEVQIAQEKLKKKKSMSWKVTQSADSK